ncbi:MAG: response regulator [Xanthomonadaceae bacterium]|nr:response regulator [Xanthomonadaceae bacterium]MDE2256192.1 response regulator [Xanthomonadaceae bacterium]
MVDDEAGIRYALTRLLRKDGYRILTASSGAEALDVLAVNLVQVIISDQRMPGMSGAEFLAIGSNCIPYSPHHPVGLYRSTGRHRVGQPGCCVQILHEAVERRSVARASA